MNIHERRTALRRLQEIDFALIDANLYLDTHPTCPHGLEYFRRLQAERGPILAEYERRYGPITFLDTEAEGYWNWINDPWPWELEA